MKTIIASLIAVTFATPALAQCLKQDDFFKAAEERFGEVPLWTGKSDGGAYRHHGFQRRHRNMGDCNRRRQERLRHCDRERAWAGYYWRPGLNGYPTTTARTA